MSNKPLRIFIGYDHRQPVSLNVLQQSIYKRSTKPVSITPLVLEQLPIKRQGLTPFTFSRFLVPYLCDYEGWALFLDADMLLMDDISKLFDMADETKDVMVAKKSKRFEWASAMLFNCAKCTKLTPEYIETTGDKLHWLQFAEEENIGELPGRWNHLVGYDKPCNDVSLIHYTQGIPGFDITKDCEHAKLWLKDHKSMNAALPWEVLMGKSVHSRLRMDGKLVPAYKVEPPK